MVVSKSKVDRFGNILARDLYKTEEELIDAEDILDDYRKAHLQPLTEATLEIQSWLAQSNSTYYIAQRLKRKPQILRKLRRLSVRLTQLQDIAGCRIIVESNRDVDNLYRYIEKKAQTKPFFRICRATDYREKGRDDSGYRALHLILEKDNRNIELQIRSNIQHYWAENIERTSVIYGYHLKEQEGDRAVIAYFKLLSDIFYEIEAGRQVTSIQKLDLSRQRDICEKLIKESDKHNILNSHVNEDIIKTLLEKEAASTASFNNWIIVFDWNSGNFVSWDVIDRTPDEAIRSYVSYERNFAAAHGFEVVMIGASNVGTIRETHSHYFGIEQLSSTIEELRDSVIGFSRKSDLDIGARQILLCMNRRHYWGKKPIAVDTLRNHYCKDVFTFDSSLQALMNREYIVAAHNQGPISLNLKKKSEIERYL